MPDERPRDLGHRPRLRYHGREDRRRWGASRYLVGAVLKPICAWCEPGRRDEIVNERRVALDDPPTHGICPRHEQEILALVPSRSFPGVELLVVVDRGAATLYRQLRRAARGLRGVAVIVDRRAAARRRAGGDGVPGRERRQGDRRRRRALASGPGYVVVRLGAPRA
jgi:hypothetical protein